MPWRSKRQPSGEIMLQEVGYDGRPGGVYRDEMSMDMVKQATAAAVEEALAGMGNEAPRIMIVNVNIQLASGGGATNVVGEHSPQRHDHYHREAG